MIHYAVASDNFNDSEDSIVHVTCLGITPGLQVAGAPKRWIAPFALFMVLAQVGSSVSRLVLVNSIPDSVDPYALALFPNFVFATVFGLWNTFISFCTAELSTIESDFPHSNVFLTGVCNGVSTVLYACASLPRRTSPVLQPLLTNITLPVTVVLRFILLDKPATNQQLWAISVCIIGVVVSSLPGFLGVTGAAHQTFIDPARLVWSLCFLFAGVPVAIQLVAEEEILQTQGSVPTWRGNRTKRYLNSVWFLFWNSFYSLLTVVALVWLDFIPGFGKLVSMESFSGAMRSALFCFTGREKCNVFPVVSFIAYMSIETLASVSTVLLLRYAEGATWVAMLSALKAPLASVTWLLFSADPFEWQPNFANDSTLLFVGIAVILISLVVYPKQPPVQPSAVEADDTLHQYTVQLREGLSPRLGSG
eukprot:TRINITY_DN7778_c0_g1_i1.p1 TRINITY_DN7778_c0_g1~~TRINITY_DN7778_c0_g1_i1.p1  ORF type:complete len:432 (-),score=54.76 TRINITY_DN7778_c0_g1_i1:786-2048(-)